MFKGIVDYIARLFCKVHLYEVDGLLYPITFGGRGYSPEVRFVAQYRKWYFILDDCTWKRTTLQAFKRIEQYKRPGSPLTMLVQTGLCWNKEMPKIKRLDWKSLEVLRGSWDLVIDNWDKKNEFYVWDWNN